LTAHTYDEAKADKVIGTLNGFRKDVLVLLKELKRRNHATD
jgi:alpha-L-arabinofuranosidase